MHGNIFTIHMTLVVPLEKKTDTLPFRRYEHCHWKNYVVKSMDVVRIRLYRIRRDDYYPDVSVPVAHERFVATPVGLYAVPFCLLACVLAHQIPYIGGPGNGLRRGITLKEASAHHNVIL